MSLKFSLKSIGFYLIFTFVLAFASGANVFAACAANSNLIVNGDAEADQSAPGNNTDYDVSAWEPETGAFTIVRYSAGGGFPTLTDPGPANRGNFFFSGGQAASSSGVQTIDVSGCAAQIDAGALNFNLSGFLGGFLNSEDNARLTVSFKNAINAPLGTAVIGPVTPMERGNNTGLFSRATGGIIPSGTRSIEAVLLISRADGADNDGYADNLSLTLNLPAVGAAQIIYSRAPGNSIENNSATVWAINTDGTNDHQIAVGDQPRISPDGVFLMFRRKYSNGGAPNYQAALWIRNLTTGAESEIYANNNDYITGYDFTPTGQKILLDYGCVIVKMDYDGTNRQNLDFNCDDDAPVVRKTDGILTFHGLNGEIFTSNADGGNRQAIPNTSGNNYSPAWSSDGQFIFYTHFDGFSAFPYSNDSLYKIKPDGSGRILLKTLTGTDRFSATGVVSADDSKIYMPAIIGGVSGIYAVATDGSGAVSFAAPSSNDLIAIGSNIDSVGGITASLAPTAANVSVGGKVLFANDQGISNVRVSLTDSNGETKSATTNTFGFYRFNEVPSGATYVLGVSSKKYSFDPPTRVLNVSDSIGDLNFIAE